MTFLPMTFTGGTVQMSKPSMLLCVLGTARWYWLPHGSINYAGVRPVLSPLAVSTKEYRGNINGAHGTTPNTNALNINAPTSRTRRQFDPHSTKN